jgi:hypothetical protein
MTITALPPAPSRADPANFATKADALLGAFDTFVSETNTTAANVDTKNTNVNTKSTNVDTKSALVDGYAVSALASKNSATASESTATTNAATTSSKATTATAKALEASNSAASALSSKNAASNLALNVASTRASIRPTLLLDFASTKKLDSRVTFARSSTATVINELGVLQVVASGVPRFDHDPVTGESLGLLLEESRTNLLLNSATLVTQNVTVTAVAYSLSFYGAGTVTLSGTATGTVTGSGAYPLRSTLTFTPTAGTLTLTVSGSCTDAQLESGGGITSVIPTISSQVTRAADLAVMTGTNFSTWYRQDEGTIYAESSTVSFSANRAIWAIGDPSLTFSNANVFYELYSTGVSGKRLISGLSSGVSQVNLVVSQNSQSINTFSKGSFAYSLNNFSSTVNGESPGNDTSGLLPVNVTGLSFGSLSQGWNSASLPLNGRIRKFAFYPKRLSNIELVGLTS